MIRAAKSAVILGITIFGLASCEEGLNLGGQTTTASETTASAPGEVRTGVADVERPDIFSTQELALWDGRPSLGGIWVAHPDVKAPERAILINQTTGQRVAGALFRRERANPGPRIQVSSDAAAALNILAGQPTEMSIIAVRQEEVEVAPAPPVISDEQVGAATVDDTDAGGDAAIVAGAAGATAVETKPRGNFFQRLFGKKPRNQPAIETLTPEDTAENAAVPDVETKPLDPVASGAAAAIARAEADDKPAPRPARAATAAAAPAPAAPASGDIKNPYVQVGLFTVEENAGSAAANLRQAGIVPSIIPGSRDGELFWRVVVGPVNTAEDQAAIIAQVKKLGFTDAFLAPN